MEPAAAGVYFGSGNSVAQGTTKSEGGRMKILEHAILKIGIDLSLQPLLFCKDDTTAIVLKILFNIYKCYSIVDYKRLT